MTKTIKKLSDLPEWFQIKKYDDAKNLDEIGWYRQLIIRLMLMMHINVNHDEKTKKRFIEAANLIRKTPIIEEINDIFLSRIVDEKTNELRENLPTYTLGIHAMTYYELYQLESEIPHSKIEYIQESGRNRILSPNPPDWLHDAIYPGIDLDKHPISVNLSLPDSLLIEQFKQYLPKLRINTSTETTRKQAKRYNYKDWIRFSALPYIDLIIWSKENNLHITNRVIADAIFPNGEGGEEVVRKTVKPLIDWLFNHELHLILLSEAASKKIGRKNQ